MSGRLAMQNLLGDFSILRALPQDISGGDDQIADGDQHSATLHAPNDAEHPVSRIFQISEVGREVFGHAESVEYFAHFFFPLTHYAKGSKPTTSPHSTQKSPDDGEFVTRVAFAPQIPATMNSTAPFYRSPS